MIAFNLKELCIKHQAKPKSIKRRPENETGNVPKNIIKSTKKKSLGAFNDDINLLNKAIQYLQKESPLIKVDSPIDYSI